MYIHVYIYLYVYTYTHKHTYVYVNMTQNLKKDKVIRKQTSFKRSHFTGHLYRSH